MTENYKLIYNAIKNKKIVKAIYNNHPRVMCPHVIGTNKEGKKQALFFQFGGSSSRKGVINDGNAEWRCCAIEDLKNIQLEDGEWKTGESHSRPQTCVYEIDLKVNF